MFDIPGERKKTSKNVLLIKAGSRQACMRGQPQILRGPVAVLDQFGLGPVQRGGGHEIIKICENIIYFGGFSLRGHNIYLRGPGPLLPLPRPGPATYTSKKDGGAWPVLLPLCI